MKATRSNRAASVYLRVSYNLYKKFAKLYKDEEGRVLFDKHTNRGGKGIPKISQRRYSTLSLDDVLMGKVPHYPRHVLYKKLVATKYMEEKCRSCGYCEKRATDLKCPLILHHINGNLRDHRLPNLELLCFNCYFVLVGNMRRKDLMMHIENAEGGTDDKAQYDIKSLTEESGSVNSDQSYGDVLSDKEKIEIINKIKNT